MEITRAELMPGVWLSHLKSDKFKTACLSLNLLTQLRRETAALNALIPYVLRRGTTRSPDLEALSSRMDELYGVAIEPVVRRIGEIQCLGFYASIPEGDFLPGKQDVLRPACELLGELLLDPATRGGLLRQPIVESEKEKLADALRSRINDKRSYSVLRCIEEMCACEDFSAGSRGHAEDVEDVHYRKLTRQYRELLQRCPIELFYCGRSGLDEVSECLTDALAPLQRGEIDDDIGTELRMNALEDHPREVEEAQSVTQGKLVIGYRLGECMEEPDIPALYVFNAVLGSGTTSKLFMNVREKLQLCYYASSMIDLHKGLLLIASGVDLDKKDAALNEITAQLDAVRRGEISDEELAAARAGVSSDLRSLLDSQGELEGFYLSQALDGADYGPAELAELIGEVDNARVRAIAESVDCDLIYFLTGNGDEEGEDADNEL